MQETDSRLSSSEFLSHEVIHDCRVGRAPCCGERGLEIDVRQVHGTFVPSPENAESSSEVGGLGARRAKLGKEIVYKTHSRIVV